MALKVRTASGKPFRRCGILFGKEWTVVVDGTLNKKFGSPQPTKKSPTVGDVLMAEPMLVCQPAPKAEKEPKGDPDNKGCKPGK